eukprot:m.7389 g.7389  ORF g.7389 m.7389 type:complete len:385 (+) comp3706_c0_seq1:339-1493(+)
MLQDTMMRAIVGLLRKVLITLRNNWFLVMLVGVIFLAGAAPHFGSKKGPLHPEITVKILAVSFIFFTSGLTLKTEDLKNSVLQVRIHLFIQLFSFIGIPILIAGLVHILKLSTSLDALLLRGFIVVSCLPPPVSSAAILTRAVGGNEAAAIFNSAFGSFLGIIVTPPLLFLRVGASGDIPAQKIIISLSKTVVVPLIFGQILRYFAWRHIKSYGPLLSITASCALLLIIYSAFCDMFTSDIRTDTLSLISVVAIVAFIIVSLTALTFSISRLLGYSPADVVCISFCSTHKSLTLGLPLLRIVFADNPHISLLSLPLLAYHPLQIFLGGVSIPFMKQWLLGATGKHSSRMYSTDSDTATSPLTSRPLSPRRRSQTYDYELRADIV